MDCDQDRMLMILSSWISDIHASSRHGYNTSIHLAIRISVEYELQLQFIVKSLYADLFDCTCLKSRNDTTTHTSAMTSRDSQLPVID